MKMILATGSGLVVAESDGGSWRILRRGLEGKHITSVIAREGVILAGTTDGVFRSDDDGQTWREASQGITHRHIRWMAFHPDRSDFEFAGSEPAGIFTSTDGANSWRGAGEVSELRDRFQWFLPYSPEAGCVRGFALQGERAYAAVEVGGVLRSDDGGATWRLAEGSDGRPNFGQPPRPFVHPDVHSIQVHPSSPDLVFAPTGGGFYWSTDGGKTWESLYDCYCRAAWIDPSDPGHIIFGPADSVDSNGRIEETYDGGKRWHAASTGLEVPWRRHMVERFTQAGPDLFAVLSNGQLIAAPLDGLEWRPVLTELQNIHAITFPV